MARQIIIDTDPGLDDALAILLALASPELEVVGLTAVAGNVPLALTATNARRICELAGRRNVPVFAGCAQPLVRPLVTATVHGETGLDGAALPAPTMPLQPEHAVDWLIDTVMAAPDQALTLCALGPLTNVAAALRREQRIALRLREIVVMGGAAPQAGNVTPVAEFNIHVDPEAAEAVFRCGARLTVIPLDLTRQVAMTRPRYARLQAIDNPVGKAAAGMVGFYNGYSTGRPDREFDPLHDPCVIAWLLAPALFTGEPTHLAVETNDEASRGMTRMIEHYSANCVVLRGVDAAGFYDLLLERLARF